MASNSEDTKSTIGISESVEDKKTIISDLLTILETTSLTYRGNLKVITDANSDKAKFHFLALEMKNQNELDDQGYLGISIHFKEFMPHNCKGECFVVFNISKLGKFVRRQNFST